MKRNPFGDPVRTSPADLWRKAKVPRIDVFGAAISTPAQVPETPGTDAVPASTEAQNPQRKSEPKK